MNKLLLIIFATMIITNISQASSASKAAHDAPDAKAKNEPPAQQKNFEDNLKDNLTNLLLKAKQGLEEYKQVQAKLAEQLAKQEATLAKFIEEEQAYDKKVKILGGLCLACSFIKAQLDCRTKFPGQINQFFDRNVCFICDSVRYSAIIIGACVCIECTKHCYHKCKNSLCKKPVINPQMRRD